MRVDLTNQKFGRLTVKSLHSIRGKGESYWTCECECGRTVVVSRGNLKNGSTKSCGCLQKEAVKLALCKPIQYDLSGEYGIGFTANNNQKFYFDLDDYEKIAPYSWFMNDQGYIVAANGNHQLRMHKLVYPYKGIVDHRNRNKADNRKFNLRPATNQLNGINRGCNKTNKLGIKGVSKIRDRYYARISKDGTQISLGGYATIEEARDARIRAEIELYGEFAYVGGDSIE